MVGLSKVDIERLSESLADKLMARLSDQMREQMDQLMSVNEVAEFLDTSAGAIRTKVCRGQLKATKVGSRVYFWRTDVINYLNGRK